MHVCMTLGPQHQSQSLICLVSPKVCRAIWFPVWPKITAGIDIVIGVLVS